MKFVNLLLMMLPVILACGGEKENNIPPADSDTINWAELPGTWNMVQMTNLSRNVEVPKTVESFAFKSDSTFEAVSSFTGRSPGNWSVTGKDRLWIVQFGNPIETVVSRLTASELVWEMNLGGDKIRCILKR